MFGPAGSRWAAFDYVRALLRAEGRRSCWQLAELAGHATPRRLQELLGEYVWDAAAGITGQVENCHTVVFAAQVPDKITFATNPQLAST